MSRSGRFFQPTGGWPRVTALLMTGIIPVALLHVGLPSNADAQSVDFCLVTSLTHITSMREAAGGGGGVWAATSGGCFHFTPSSGEVDEVIVYPGDLPDMFCNDILPDAQGRLWVATDNEGVARRQDGSWSYYTTFEGLPGSGRVYCLCEAANAIWAGTDAGMARWQGEAFAPIDESTTGGAFEADDVTDMTEMDGLLWLATDRGIYSLDLAGSPFDPSSWTSFEATTDSLEIEGLVAWGSSLCGHGGKGVYMTDSIGDWNRIWDVTTVGDLAVSATEGLLAASQGVYRYVEAGPSWEETGSGYPSGYTGILYGSSILETGSGYLCCGVGADAPEVTDWGEGIAVLRDGEWDLMDPCGMPGSNCYQISLEEDGRLYVGSHLRGLMALMPQGWTHWGFEEGMPNVLRTYSSESDGSGGYWTGSYSHGLVWIGGASTWSTDDDSVICFVTDTLSWPPGLTQVVCPLLNQQVNMLVRQGDVLWIAQEAFFATPDEPSGIVAVQGLPPDPSDLVWAAREPSAGGMAFKDVRHIMAVPGSDTLWVAYEGEQGCQVLDHRGTPMDAADDIWYPAGAPLTTEDGLVSNQVNCFARDDDGTIYAGTSGGLCVFDSGSMTFSTVSGVTGGVRAMRFDRYGRLWCATTQGLFLVEQGQTVASYDESNSPYMPSSRTEPDFGEYDPLTGLLYLCSSKGLWVVDTGTGYHEEAGEVLFYPQPYLPAGGEPLRMCGPSHDEPVSVVFFTLDGRMAGERAAQGADLWSWDGTFDGTEAASGIYLVVVRHGTGTSLAKIAVVR